MAYTYEQLLELYQNGGARTDLDSFGVEGSAEPSMSPRDEGALYQLPEDPLSMGGGPTENVLPGSLTPPEQPEVLTAPQPAGVLTGSQAGAWKQGGGAGFSMGQGRSGFNQATRDQLDRQDPQVAAAKMRGRAEAEGAFATSTSAADTARQSGIDAAEATMDARMAQLSDEQATALHMEKLQNTFKDDELKIHTREAATRNKMMADYQASLADFAASKVDPNDLWHGMSGGMRFGTMVSAFVHDFLGAKGIKTSAMDNLKNAVDRNIAAQIQNINKKGEVAKGFKTLFDMEGARSASAEEQRLRIRGYMLEAAKSHVVANMSSYKSLLATAEGRKALAELDKEYAKTIHEVNTHIDQSSRARTAQDLDWIKHKNQIAMESWRNSIAAKANTLAERKYEDELNQRKAAAMKMQHENTLIDPADGLGKKLIVRGNDKEKQNVRENLINSAETNRALKDFRELAKNNQFTYLDAAGTRRWSAEGRKLADALRYRLAHSQVKANGERATEPDVQQYLKMFPLDEIASSGIEGMHAYAQNTTLKHANEYIQQYTEDLPKDQWIKAGESQYFAEDQLESGATYNEQIKRGGKKDQATDIAGKLMGAPDGKVDEDVLEKSGYDKKDVDLDYGAAVKQDPTIGRPVFKADMNSIVDIAGYGTRGAKPPKAVPEKEAPSWAAGVMVLGEEAKKGGSNGQAARDKLTHWATRPTAEIAQDPLLQQYEIGDIKRIQAYARYKTLNFAPKKFKGKSTMVDPGVGANFEQPGATGVNPYDVE